MPLIPSPRPAVFTIPPNRSFVDALADGVIERFGGSPETPDPASLARVLVLLPTRRACRSLREAFLRRTGGAPTLLPQLRPIGDVDEDELTLTAGEAGLSALAPDLPPAIGETRRRLLLARLILGRPDRPTADQAAWLARELARLLDQVQTERLGFDGLKGLVPDAFAAHWQETLRFLEIVTENWPAVLAEEGALDPADRRNRLIDAQAEAWRADPSPTPVIAAGSTGSIPATADLLAVVAGLPQGALILPGLDTALDEHAWEAARGDQTHPQYGLAQLLDRLGTDRAAIEHWAGHDAPDDRHERATEARVRLVSEALRPAATTDRWRAALEKQTDAARAVEKIAYCPCPSPRDEAGVIALAMRHALEDTTRTAALVTPDRDLARRVAVELGRWNIVIDDSAGVPLESTPPGAYLRLVASMVAQDLAPVPLLAALKHPFAAAGADPAVFRAETRLAEVYLLRGPRPGPGIGGLRARIEGAVREAEARRRPIGERDQARLRHWVDRLDTAIAPFAEAYEADEAPVGALLRAHVAAAERLATTEERPGGSRLWAGDAGEEAAGFVADLDQSSRDFPAIVCRQYHELFDALMAGRVVRPRYGAHPRLAIYGLLEARLQQADLMILGGLNEGAWPAEPPADPWMSRPMREAFGLPLPERRIGLSAHDFAQAFCAPEVLMTRAERVEGTPMVASRWITRIDAVMRGLGLVREPDDAPAFGQDGQQLLDWFRLRDMPRDVQPAARPAPKPPVDARPRKLPVTQIEAWRRDPYAVYARNVLRLSALDPLDADPGAAERGLFIHDALDAFVARYPRGELPADALDELLACGEEALGAARDRPEVRAFWWPRFERIANWFLDVEAGRRPEIAESRTELRGAWTFAAPGGDFTVTARADRIDLRADGTADIIDYKTGTLPSNKDVEAGWSPQLPLEAIILAEGGFGDIGKLPVRELQYWRVRGADPPGELRRIRVEKGAMLDTARAGLADLVAHFDKPATPFLAAPHPGRALAYNDYAHLAREGEWSAEGGEDHGAGEGGR